MSDFSAFRSERYKMLTDLIRKPIAIKITRWVMCADIVIPRKPEMGLFAISAVYRCSYIGTATSFTYRTDDIFTSKGMYGAVI